MGVVVCLLSWTSQSFSFLLQGYKYIVPEGECCGRCQKTACEEQHFWSRGDEDPPLHEVRHQWDGHFSLLAKASWNYFVLHRRR